MTYSIIARDPDTGAVGATGQSHFFNAGAHVFFAEAGVGIVAAQMMPEPTNGARALALLRGGTSAEETLRNLRAADPAAGLRQTAIVTVGGDAAAFTGAQCVAHSVHWVSDGVTAQSAMCRDPGIARAMVDAFQRATGPFAERLLDALDAAETLGGDWRGRKSASIVIVADSASAPVPNGRVMDLRVEDHPDPLVALRRLVVTHRFHARAGEALGLALGGRVADALEGFDVLEHEDADEPDVAFRHALALVMSGAVERARERLEVCYQLNEGWRSLVERLPAAGLIPDDPRVLDILLAPRAVGVGSAEGRLSR